MLFWSIIAALLAACVFLIWRSWVKNLGNQPSEAGSDAALYDARLEEIARDLEDGRLDDEAAQIAKAEAARQLLKAENQKHAAASSTRPNGWWMTAAIVSVPTLSLLIYLGLGSPPSLIPVATNDQITEQTLDNLVATAEKRLESHPDDIQGWQVLAPVYMRQNRFDKAETAFRNLLRLEGPNPQLLSTIGELIVARSDGNVSDEAQSFFNQTLELDQKNVTARFFIGMAALQRGEAEKAKNLWQQLIDDAKGDEDWLPSLRQRVAQLSPQPEASKEQKAQEILNLDADEQRARIEGMVATLANRLEENPDDKKGWVRLVRAYMVLGMSEEAVEAVQSASQAHAADAEFLEQLTAMLDAEEKQNQSGESQ